MELHWRKRKSVQRYEPFDSILQRVDNMGEMDQSQHWSFQNQSLLPRSFSHALCVSISSLIGSNNNIIKITFSNSFKWQIICRGREWNAPTRSCKSETKPYFGIKYPAGTPLASVIVNKVLSRIKKPVYLLDITLLSQYRKDAHPTLYSLHNGLDCSHWCLPGLPDTWNLLLYTALFGWQFLSFCIS